MYCVYGNSIWHIHGAPLFGGGRLLGGSVIGGSTALRCIIINVHTKLLSHDNHACPLPKWQRRPNSGILHGMLAIMTKHSLSQERLAP